MLLDVPPDLSRCHIMPSVLSRRKEREGGKEGAMNKKGKDERGKEEKREACGKVRRVVQRH